MAQALGDVTRPGPNRQQNRDWNANWRLGCEICGHLFSDEGTIGAIELHFDIEDGHDPDDIRLVTVWVGDGPEPPPETLNRAARRARDRRREHMNRQARRRRG